MATNFLYFISRSKVSANKVGVSIGKFLLYDPALGHQRRDRGHVLDDASRALIRRVYASGGLLRVRMTNRTVFYGREPICGRSRGS